MHWLQSDFRFGTLKDGRWQFKIPAGSCTAGEVIEIASHGHFPASHVTHYQVNPTNIIYKKHISHP